MSLVSNFIGGIGVNGLGNISSPQKFDTNGIDFEELLKKQMETDSTNETNNIMGVLGMPAGMQIENIDFSEKVQDQMEALGSEIKTEDAKLDTNGDGSITSSEAVTFFSSLLDNNINNTKSELFDFAKKQASNLYHKYSRSVVTDVKEFVEDIQGLVS